MENWGQRSLDSTEWNYYNNETWNLSIKENWGQKGEDEEGKFDKVSRLEVPVESACDVIRNYVQP